MLLIPNLKPVKIKNRIRKDAIAKNRTVSKNIVNAIMREWLALKIVNVARVRMWGKAEKS